MTTHVLQRLLANLQTGEENWKDKLNTLITSILHKDDFTWAFLVFSLGASLGPVLTYKLLFEWLFQSQKDFGSAATYQYVFWQTSSTSHPLAHPSSNFSKGKKGKGSFQLPQKSLECLPWQKSLFDEGWGSEALNLRRSQSLDLWNLTDKALPQIRSQPGGSNLCNSALDRAV